MMQKSRNLKLQQFYARLQEMEKYTPQFPGSDESKNIPQEELNDILLYNVTHGRAKESMVLRFDFESESFQSAMELFDLM